MNRHALPRPRPRPLRQLLALTALAVASPALLAQAAAPGAFDRGRYLVKIGGCNDCHTAGYTQNEGKVPEKDWLQGDALGWQGPWGTTYATNLRLQFASLTEAQWLEKARTMRSRPPMPWFVLREMTDADLKALYAYIRQAGPAGRPAPTALAPGVPAAGPVVKFPG